LVLIVNLIPEKIFLFILPVVFLTHTPLTIGTILMACTFDLIAPVKFLFIEVSGTFGALSIHSFSINDNASADSFVRSGRF
jgi:hypothetical protein